MTDLPPAPRRVEIPAFPRNLRIAVTTSFDDGTVEDRQVVEAFNRWGLKGTFNLNSGLLTRHGRPAGHGAHHLDACEVAALYAGHEVAVHMVTHPWPTRLDNTQIAAEVLDDRRALEDLVGYPVRGMAYPFGDYNQRVIEVLRQCGIVYSRTVEASPRCFPPAEPLAWPATGHQFDEKPEPMAVRFSRWYDSGGTGVFFVWGHSFEFDRRNDWQALETIYRPLSGKSDVWYATNLELFDYEAARRSMVIAANRRSAYNPSALAVTLNVDGTLIDAAPGVVTPLSV